MNGWKLLAGAGLTAAAAGYGTAAYFFRRTMIRQNAKTERTMDMAGTDWEQYMPMLEELKEKQGSYEKEELQLRSDDGLLLHGTYFPNGGGNRLILCLHGYTSEGASDFIGLSDYYLPRGYQMLLIDERAHGKSEGTYIGFGCLDRRDVLKWISCMQERLLEDCEIWLHGVSMGAAAALMTAGLNMPSCVKGIISDCAFTSAWDVFEHVLKSMYHLPAFPILAIADRMTKHRAGFGLAECSSAEEVKKAKVPILFIHGEADTFVPCSMCYEIYNNCASPKDILIVKGAGHVEAFYKNRELYEEKLNSFLEKKGAGE